jgi:CheY-like chemotaxis protein
MRIIVVDGVGFTRHSLKQTLTEMGHSVVAFGTAEEGLEALKRDNTVGAVVTELMLPAMDAIGFYRAAQSIDRYDDTGPIPPPAFVLVTTDNRSSLDGRKSQLLQKALDLGFADILLKPVPRQSLELALAGVAAGQRGAPAHAASDVRKPPKRSATGPSGAPTESAQTVASLERQLAELRAALQSMQQELAASIGRPNGGAENRPG